MPPQFLRLPSSTLGTLLGFLAQEAELEQMGGLPPGELNLSSWSLLVRASPWGVWKGSLLLAPPSLPPNQGGQWGAKFPPQQVPVIYLKIVANIWYNCLRKHSNKAACSSIAERASLLNDNKLLASPLRWIHLTDVCLVLAIVSHCSFGDYAQLETITIKEVWTCSIFTSHPLLPCSEV